MRTLPHPPDAERDPDSLEMLRGWIVEGEIQVSLAAWVWQETPEEWGRFLAESANHLADAIASQTGHDRAGLYAAISQSVIYHLQHPPTDLGGEFHDGPSIGES